MAKERLKIIQAGTLWMAVQYTAIRSANQTARREARSQISTPARESLNARLSWQKLMLVLAANFHSTDLVVTLTYRDDDLPKTKDEADKRLKAFLRAFREERKAAGMLLKRVRVTEGYHSSGRLHHHLIINATGGDYEIIRRLWQRNGDNIDFEPFGIDGPERWAKYLTKEPREKGRRYVGERTWTTSRNMRKPIVSCGYVPAETALSPPPDALVLDKAQCENCYGRFQYMMARMPESKTEYPENQTWGSV